MQFLINSFLWKIFDTKKCLLQRLSCFFLDIKSSRNSDTPNTHKSQSSHYSQRIFIHPGKRISHSSQLSFFHRTNSIMRIQHHNNTSRCRTNAMHSTSIFWVIGKFLNINNCGQKKTIVDNVQWSIIFSYWDRNTSNIETITRKISSSRVYKQ